MTLQVAKHSYIDRTDPIDAQAIRYHYFLLGHQGFGATELRVFDGKSMVAYVDNPEDMVHLCRQMQDRKGIYVSVQPRCPSLFDHAPNRWRPARDKQGSYCGGNKDIEYITCCFWDIDVVSEHRPEHPASDEELRSSLAAARRLAKEDELSLNSVICCSGNGHYVLAPLVPLEIADDETLVKYKLFCQRLRHRVSGQVKQVRLDNVFDGARVMRVMGTMNRKGLPVPERPHRRACFVSEPHVSRSMTLHEIIDHIEIPPAKDIEINVMVSDIGKLEQCGFIRFCRDKPQEVTEPQWFGLITNLVHLEGGIAQIHEISRLDKTRYDFHYTQYVIQRVLDKGYKAIGCKQLLTEEVRKQGYDCELCDRCEVKAPMYWINAK